MALSLSVKLHIENLILGQLGEEYRRLNLSLVAGKTGVDQSTVALAARNLVMHNRIETSPVKRYWYRLVTTTPQNEEVSIGRLLENQTRLENRISQLESRLLGPNAG